MSAITYDDRSSTWLLSTPSTSYGFVLAGPHRIPRHLHWGRLLGHEALGAMATGGELMANGNLTWQDETRFEYLVWGGLRFDEPSLKVDFADGTRGIEWRHAGSRVEEEGGATSLVVELIDLVYPLKVELCYRVFDDSDVIERWARLVHTGDGARIVVHQAHSANWWLPERGCWRLTFLQGGWGSETQLAERIIGREKVVLESRRGTTSHEFQPFFALDADGEAGEEHGEVWSGQLGVERVVEGRRGADSG